MTGLRFILCAMVCLVLAGIAWALQGHDANPDFPPIPLDHEAIQYSEAPGDPVARLQQRMEQGEVTLDFQPRWGYLPSVLKHLAINPDSQVLVFSRTSSQVSYISPATPRAIYFNDSVAVGYVQGGRALELTSLDPVRGIVFYLMDVEKTDQPSFDRQDIACLQCHLTPATLNIPGLMVSTVYATDEESPQGRAGSFVTDHRTPLEDRWGGWYVTGTHGGMRQRGNIPVDRFQRPSEAALQQSQNLTSLATRFNTSAYLSPSSDIVALMTLEHQTHITNLITRIGWETRVAAAEGALKDFRARLDESADELVAYLLFAEEAPIREPIQGASSFTKTFPQRGPREKQGRSLRDFDLQKRLFRYPLSYMIYSEAFDALPGAAREQIYQRLFDVLTGKNTDQKFARFSPEDRRAILEILRETKPQLPGYWKAAQ